MVPIDIALNRAATDSSSILPPSALGKAVHYARERWIELTRYAHCRKGIVTHPGFFEHVLDSVYRE